MAKLGAEVIVRTLVYRFSVSDSPNGVGLSPQLRQAAASLHTSRWTTQSDIELRKYVLYNELLLKKMKTVNFKNTLIPLLIATMAVSCGGGTSVKHQNSVSETHNEEPDLMSNTETLLTSAYTMVESRTTDGAQEEPFFKDVYILREGGTLPEYATGDVWQYINDNVRFPAETLNRSDNRVIIHFIVERDGSLNNISLFAGSYPALDTEVLRVAKSMSKWKPGKLANGETVRITYLLGGVYQMEDGRIKLSSISTMPPQQYQGEVLTIADKFPQFSGGIIALQKFIADNMQYPAEAMEYLEEGLVAVSFTVQPTGEIIDIHAIGKCRHNDSCPPTSFLLGKEATRIVSSMPNWIPGEHEGKKVAVRYVLPINFKL